MYKKKNTLTDIVGFFSQFCILGDSERKQCEFIRFYSGMLSIPLQVKKDSLHWV